MIFISYERARNSAWQCLIDCKINSLPLKFSILCDYYNVDIFKDSILDPDSPARLSPYERGEALRLNGRYYIVVNDRESIQVQRYTLAHEFGHIIMHTVDEYETERFAVDILAPACVLWGCNVHSAEDIAAMCNISRLASQHREERMRVLYQRGKFLTSPLERQVYENFSDFIIANRKD